ncbi:MAG: hypothetical protein HYY25_04985 [Candidatus Wallbacteria bacterium]|nr:hypothetical protein [Candidatus Wallbacteria bacterium]
MSERNLSAAVLAAGVVLGLVGQGPARPVGVEQLFGGLAVLVFVQGLIRDMTVLGRRRAGKPGQGEGGLEPPECLWELNLCLESTVGVLMLVAAAALWFAPGTGLQLQLPLGALLTGAGAVLVAGWATRDWVLTLRHVRSHYDLPVWRKPGTHDLFPRK